MWKSFLSTWTAWRYGSAWMHRPRGSRHTLMRNLKLDSIYQFLQSCIVGQPDKELMMVWKGMNCEGKLQHLIYFGGVDAERSPQLGKIKYQLQGNAVRDVRLKGMTE
ncbi:hypothetical protein RJT34_10779 [Clitoria ternatea]|uniref:Uncharacterized protein n=1 Tax=Clitoria ternatea TaxID=43366 RepID=A0AAN9JJ99_CLITE